MIIRIVMGGVGHGIRLKDSDSWCLNGNFNMKKFKKSSQGFLTVQFMLALVFIMFFIVSFLGLALTLVHASLTQYLTYSSARKLALGGETKSSQKDAGKNKYTTIRQDLFNTAFQTSSGSDWFYISDAGIGPNPNYSNQESSDPGARRLFFGSYVEFKSNVTNFAVPLWTDKTSGDLETSIGSYMGREPSREECKNFFQNSTIPIGTSDGYPSVIGGQTVTPIHFENFSDNGC